MDTQVCKGISFQKKSRLKTLRTSLWSCPFPTAVKHLPVDGQWCSHTLWDILSNYQILYANLGDLFRQPAFGSCLFAKHSPNHWWITFHLNRWLERIISHTRHQRWWKLRWVKIMTGQPNPPINVLGKQGWIRPYFAGGGTSGGDLGEVDQSWTQISKNAK